MVRQLAFAGLAFLLGARSAPARVLVVAPDGSGDYPTIQAALNAAQGGDVVELTDGVFTGPGNRQLVFATFDGLLRSASGDPARSVLALEGYPIGVTDFAESFAIEGIGFSGGQRLDVSFGTIELRACRFEGCAGALRNSDYLDWYGSTACYDCAFIACSGLIVQSGDLTMERCRFEGNSGQAIHGAYLTLLDCDFLGNASEEILVRIWGAETMFGEGDLRNCRFDGNQAERVLYAAYNMDVALNDCRFTRNTGTTLHSKQNAVTLTGCTFAGNAGAAGADVLVESYIEYLPNSLDVQRCIFAFRADGEVLVQIDLPPATSVACSDVFGNAGGDWSGPLAPFAGLDGNFAADPLFCDLTGGDVSLYDISPCLPGNHPGGQDCGRIGAEGQGCVDPTDAPGIAPAAMCLRGHPTPFNPRTRLVFSLPDAGTVDLAIYDGAGRRLRRLLAAAALPAGSHALMWDGRDDAGRALPAGLYLARLSGAAGTASAKLLLAK